MVKFTKELNSFQDADYYSLVEAAEYLNQKYNKYIFTDYTVLKQLLAFKIPAHVYSFGLTTMGSEFIFKNDLIAREDRKESLVDRDEMLVNLSDFLGSECCKNGLFFELKQQDLIQLFMRKYAITQSFQDAIPFDYIASSLNLKEVIEKIWKDTLSAYSNEKKNEIADKQMNKIKALFDNFISVENIFNTKDMQNYLGTKHYLEAKPEVIEIDKDLGHMNDYCFFKIVSGDLFVLKKNLYQLEKYVLGEEIYVESIKNIEVGRNLIQSPRGKSKNKEKAQGAARTLATYFWKNDLKQEIRIKEMCVIVYGELLHTEHKEQLPDQCPSIKEWIKDVAPSYAREAGRPREI